MFIFRPSNRYPKTKSVVEQHYLTSVYVIHERAPPIPHHYKLKTALRARCATRHGTVTHNTMRTRSYSSSSEHVSNSETDGRMLMAFDIGEKFTKIC